MTGTQAVLARAPYLLAWALLLGAAVTFLMMPIVGGILFALSWTLVVALFRLIAATAPSRRTRLALDLLLVIVCPIAAWEGGLYVLPAAAAFFVADAAAGGYAERT
jgi:hypothetical protein